MNFVFSNMIMLPDSHIFFNPSSTYLRRNKNSIAPDVTVFFSFFFIYIYTRFQKGFHIERYIDRYILLFSCTCALEHFSLLIVQLVKKLGSTMNFVFVRFLVLISQKKKNAQILSAILLFCMLLKIKECGIRSVVGHIIVVVTG